jgi:hypothetical protein
MSRGAKVADMPALALRGSLFFLVHFSIAVKEEILAL